MYHEEKIINGIMHYRLDPRNEFIPYTIEELSSRYERANANLNKLYRQKEEILAILQEKA